MRRFSRSFVLPFVAFPAFFAVACGGGSASNGTPPAQKGADAGPTSDAGQHLSDGGFVQAAHTPFPKIIWGGAPLLLAPKVVNVTFPGDSMATQLEAFGVGATQTAWWSTMMPDYCEGDGGACVGPGPKGTSVAMTAAPPSLLDDNNGVVADGGVDLPTWIDGLVDGGTLPASDPNTLYVFYIPPTVTVDMGGPGCGNGGWDGYHSESNDGRVYAIAMECPASGGSAAYGVNDVTLTASHEITEAASDGTGTNTTYGYYIDVADDPFTYAWNDEQDGEIADMCVDYLGTGLDHWTEGTFIYQRVWSIKAAALNKNPCLPVPTGEIYFNAAPAQPYIELAVGGSFTVEVDAFSDQPRGDWTLLAQDVTDPSTAYVTVSFAGGTAAPTAVGGGSLLASVNNGTKAQLTVTLTADPSKTTNGEADLMIWSYDGTDLNNATANRYWPMAIMTPATAATAGPNGGPVVLLDGGTPAFRTAKSTPAGLAARFPGHGKRRHPMRWNRFFQGR